MTERWLHRVTERWLHLVTVRWLHQVTVTWFHVVTERWRHLATVTWCHLLTEMCVEVSVVVVARDKQKCHHIFHKGTAAPTNITSSSQHFF